MSPKRGSHPFRGPVGPSAYRGPAGSTTAATTPGWCARSPSCVRRGRLRDRPSARCSSPLTSPTPGSGCSSSCGVAAAVPASLLILNIRHPEPGRVADRRAARRPGDAGRSPRRCCIRASASPPCYPIIAAFAAYTCPEVPTWALGGLTLALSLFVQSQLPAVAALHGRRFRPLRRARHRRAADRRAADRALARRQEPLRPGARHVPTSCWPQSGVRSSSPTRVAACSPRIPPPDRLLHSERAHCPASSARPCSGLHVGERRLDCDADASSALARWHSSSKRIPEDARPTANEPR